MSIEVTFYEKIWYLHEHEGSSQPQRVIFKILGISLNTVKKLLKVKNMIEHKKLTCNELSQTIQPIKGLDELRLLL